MISGLLRKMTGGKGIPEVMDSEETAFEKMLQANAMITIRDSLIFAMFQSPETMEIISKGKTQIYGVSNARQAVLKFDGNMMFGSNLEGEPVNDYKTFIKETLEKQDTIGIVPIQENQYNFLSKELGLGEPNLVGFQVAEARVDFTPVLYLGR